MNKLLNPLLSIHLSHSLSLKHPKAAQLAHALQIHYTI